MAQYKPDNIGNQYTANFEQLYSAKAGITSILIKASATSIFGESNSKYAFSQCSKTIETIKFEENSQLKTIQVYGISYCPNLKLIDFSTCTKLETIESWAIIGAEKLTTITFPSSLKSIERSAFNSCGLTSVTFPSSLNFLGYLSFAYTKSLKEVIFDKDVNITELRGVFKLSKIESIDIPKSISLIDGEAFQDVTTIKTITVQQGGHFCIIDDSLCTADKTKLVLYPAALQKDVYTIPSSVTELCTRSFSNAKINEVKFHNKVTTIEKGAFYNSEIKRAELPDSLTSLKDETFAECSSLSEVLLPTKISSLPNKLLSKTNITNVTIPESVTSIGNGCFEFCENLEKVVLHSKIGKLGGGAFTGCPKLKLEFEPGSPLTIDNQSVIYSDKGASLSQYIGSENNARITIPSDVTTVKTSSFKNAKNVVAIIFASTDKLTTIETDAFASCSNLGEINLPSTVVTIGQNAFGYCTSLKSIHFGSSLRYIYRWAFQGCTELVTVTFDNYVGSEHLVTFEKIFSGCKKITTINLGEGLYEIGTQFARGCELLEEIILPKSLQVIGEYAFESSGLTKVTFRDSQTSLETIGINSFAKANKLNSFEFASGIKVIGTRAFAETSLETIYLPPSVTTLDQMCFSCCYNLTFVDVSNENSQLQTINMGIFQNCMKLQRINLNNDYFVTENAGLFSKDKTRIIVFPPASPVQFFSLPLNVLIISPGAFYSCDNLVSVMIPDKAEITTIGANAFTDCKNLQTINIPNCIKEVGADAFLGCKSLKCGVFVSNTDKSFIEKLISNAKLSRKAIVSCSYFHTAVRCSVNFPRATLLPLFIMLFA